MPETAPIIGIPSRRVTDMKGAPPLTGVRESYAESVLAAGGAPVFFPLTDRESVLRSLYEKADGILLPGGEDVNPERYGEAPHPKLGPVDDLRDLVELRLAKWSFIDNKPLLGICRGIQVMNVALGGTLYQDITSQKDGALAHLAKGGVRRWVKAAHRLDLNADSQLAKILETNSLDVNTVHHQALKDVAPLLKVTGTAPDGVIEAVETPEKPFFLGIQCHPESLWQKTDSRWLKLFRALVKAAGGFRPAV